MSKLIRTENIEYIARDVGERYSGPKLVERLKRMGVPESVIIYPNTKWRMIFDVINYYSNFGNDERHYTEKEALQTLSEIVGLSVHPLNFATSDVEASKKITADFNKRLAFDKLCIQEVGGDISLVRLSPIEKTMTSVDYVIDAVNYFKEEYNKIRLTGLTYEYELGTNIDSLTSMYDADDVYKNIEETNGRTKAIEQLAKIGFVKDYKIEERSKGNDTVGYDYAICVIDEARITQKEEPRATDFGAQSVIQKVVHEHTHRFENSVQEKPIDLYHKHKNVPSRTLYITKEGEDYRYKGTFLRLSKKSDWYKVFCALYALLPEGGEIEYGKLIAEIKSRIPKTKNKTGEEMRKFIQQNLTDKNNGFVRYAGIPATEDNGKPLINILRDVGVQFNNLIA